MIAEFAERVTATLPDELDTVFFVNSGSEATDLAIRIAMAATGRPDIVAMREAYHGWTFASDAVSTSIADNPNALATRPDWVHTVDAANGYRGVHRGADADRYAPEAVSVIDALADAGTPPAGFICESFFGNAGGVALPDGYLDQVYTAVRRHGGIAIADEVQVGYGRLGEWFWGFQQQGSYPTSWPSRNPWVPGNRSASSSPAVRSRHATGARDTSFPPRAAHRCPRRSGSPSWT